MALYDHPTPYLCHCLPRKFLPTPRKFLPTPRKFLPTPRKFYLGSSYLGAPSEEECGEAGHGRRHHQHYPAYLGEGEAVEYHDDANVDLM